MKDLENDFKLLKNEKNAISSQRFFKTNKNEYGEGDIFLGIRNPELRALVKKYNNLSFENIKSLLYSKYHEKRLFAGLYLVKLFKESQKKRFNPDIKIRELEQKKIYDFYLKHKAQINNWDIVDTTTPHIIGAYLIDKSDEEKSVLYKLAVSESLWDRRIAIITTWYFIRNYEFDDALKLSKILLNDKEDLIHKAVGWMLRELGKKDQDLEEKFLIENNYKTMPRTLLRYAIEKFEETKRKKYLNGLI